MKILLAPDSYKGSLTAIEVANAMEKGFRRAIPEVDTVKLPIGDGGEGTAEAFIASAGGEKVVVQTVDPLGREISGYLVLIDNGQTAIVEMAVASGLTLLSKEERNPLRTSTYGTGLLIQKALDLGVEKILVAVGGSATNDGGLGMAIALGAVFKDQRGRVLSGSGNDLSLVSSIDLSGLDTRLSTTEILVLCDVDNPFYGINGAAEIYARQKGATEEQVKHLDAGLKHLVGIIEHDLSINVQNLKGSGAAGGLGGGLVAFLGASLIPGIENILSVTKIEQHLQDATLVVTGEGRTDIQTLQGKAPFGVMKRAQEAHVPTIIVSGALGDGIDQLVELGAKGVFSIQATPSSLEDSMNNAEILVENFCFNIGVLLSTFLQ